MRAAIARLRAGREAGMTLVELLVYSLLLVAILSLAGGIIINSVTTQTTVTSVSSAASSGQLISTNVSTGIRNASAFSVGAKTTLGQDLRSRTVRISSTGTVTWRCEAWYLTTAGDFYIKTSTTGAVSVPTGASDLSTWTLLAKNVSIPTGTAQAFTGASGQLSLAFRVGAGDADPVLIRTTIVSRPQTDTETAPKTCF